MAEKPEAIKYDKNNYRIHNAENKQLIKKSLEECGAGRSILIDNENEIIAGNGVYEQAKAMNIPVKVIETDGTELIAVKRTDLQTDSNKRKQLAVMDNSTSDLSEFDYDLLKEDFELDYLNNLGIELHDISDEIEKKDISNDLKEIYEVVCECKNEQEQEELFNKLTEEGIKCRLLIS